MRDVCEYGSLLRTDGHAKGPPNAAAATAEPSAVTATATVVEAAADADADAAAGSAPTVAATLLGQPPTPQPPLLQSPGAVGAADA
eukprot:1814749-Prymnesium_polylepis.1